MVCILATRKSPLALRQAEIVAELIRTQMNLEVELLPLTTSGDQRLDWSLQDKGGKGLFTKELELALLGGQADLAVHSAKDMPTDSPDGLSLSSFLEREDVRDVLVLRDDIETPKVLASGSPRRVAQLRNRFPDTKWNEMRGNVETRLKKIALHGEADGTILAAAGLKRLGIESFPGLKFEHLPVDEMVPAPGQAAIAVQTRKEDEEKFSVLGHPETEKAVCLERMVLESMGGGCQVAVGAYSDECLFRFFHEKTGFLKLGLDCSDKELTDELIRRVR
jgi:hydroxymethylbilane synthase|tara:strand:- start:249 stop:1082 length:834 start_codon:yes stop_codon:yes gene_type:complete